MRKEYIGLRTYLYVFDLDHYTLFVRAARRLARFGAVTEVFLENAHGFILKLRRQI
jgi:hypothetical protein